MEKVDRFNMCKREIFWYALSNDIAVFLKGLRRMNRALSLVVFSVAMAAVPAFAQNAEAPAPAPQVALPSVVAPVVPATNLAFLLPIAMGPFAIGVLAGSSNSTTSTTSTTN